MKNKLSKIFEFDFLYYLLFEIDFSKETKIVRTNDLIPKGIKSTIISDNYGTVEDFNNVWKYIYSQTRNLELAEKEYHILNENLNKK